MKKASAILSELYWLFRADKVLAPLKILEGQWVSILLAL